MRKLLFILILLPIFCRSESVSIIVPCHYVHFKYLPELLENLSHQTVLPEEVVISVSEANRIEEHLKNNLKRRPYPFRVHFIFNNAKLYAGQNRNAACKQASGNILICQDADDVPHPQRVEIIKYFITTYGAKHLIHTWMPTSSSFAEVRYDKNQIRFRMIKDPEGLYPTTTYGACAITRDVFEKIQWPNNKTEEDAFFNMNVMRYYQRTVVIDAPIYMYRNEYSSFRS